MTKIAVIYHSRFGHTKTLAEEAAKGVKDTGSEAILVSVTEPIDWVLLDSCDALIFGSPTYSGSVSGEFKLHFMDAATGPYFNQTWKNKIAAGFTNSHSASGDKLTTLIQMAVFAAQNGMIWVGQAEKRSGSAVEDVNRLGSYMGAMAQCDPSLGELLPPEGDRKTAFLLGKRVAEIAGKLKPDVNF